MRRMLLLFALAAGVAALAPFPVSAQETGADTEARTLFEEGRAAYDAGRFEDATRAFRRAYLLSSRYQLLYNIGQSELRAGRDALALEAFEAFLRQATDDDPHRSEVEERARMLRRMGVASADAESGTVTASVADPTPSPATTPQPVGDAATTTIPAPTATTDEGPGIAPWILVGGGAAAIVVGAIVMGVGASESARVTSATDGARWADLEGASSSVNVLWGAGIGVAAVGLVAVGVGLAWGLGGGGSSERAATARLRIGPMGLAVEGAF